MCTGEKFIVGLVVFVGLFGIITYGAPLPSIRAAAKAVPKLLGQALTFVGLDHLVDSALAPSKPVTQPPAPVVAPQIHHQGQEKVVAVGENYTPHVIGGSAGVLLFIIGVIVYLAKARMVQAARPSHTVQFSSGSSSTAGQSARK